MLRSLCITPFSTREIEGKIESSSGRLGLALPHSLRLGLPLVAALGFEMGILEEI
jgi:hypothetical protein